MITFVKTPEPSGNFVILNITEDDVEREGGWPLPRQRLAEIQVELINNGAIGVGWVISFPQADRMGGDEIFSESLNLHHQFWLCLKMARVIILQHLEQLYLVMIMVV